MSGQPPPQLPPPAYAPPADQGYPPAQVGYPPPQDAGYPPPQGGFGYPPQGGVGYPPPHDAAGYPPPQANYPPAPPQQAAATTVVVHQQPVPQVRTIVFRDRPVLLEDGTQTVLRYKSSILTWLICCVLCFVLWEFCLCWIGLIVFCIDGLKNVEHVHPSTGQVVGVYKRL